MSGESSVKLWFQAFNQQYFALILHWWFLTLCRMLHSTAFVEFVINFPLLTIKLLKCLVKIKFSIIVFKTYMNTPYGRILCMSNWLIFTGNRRAGLHPHAVLLVTLTLASFRHKQHSKLSVKIFNLTLTSFRQKQHSNVSFSKISILWRFLP